MAKDKLTICPECDTALSPVEIKVQQCDTCGWPDSMEEENLEPYCRKEPNKLPQYYYNKQEPNGDWFIDD